MKSAYEIFNSIKNQLPEDVRIEYKKALKLIEINDIEMAAVRIGRIIEKILMKIIDTIPESDFKNDIKINKNTCMDTMIQKITTSSFNLPKQIRTYICLIRDFRNAAAHDGYVDEHAIEVVIQAFRGIIPWFIETIMIKSRPFTHFITDKNKLNSYTDIVKIAMVDGILHEKELQFIENKRIEFEMPKEQSSLIIKNVLNGLIHKQNELEKTL
jgi:hypothetical protein